MTGRRRLRMCVREVVQGRPGCMIYTGADLHALRDPTRAGVATTLNEIAIGHCVPEHPGMVVARTALGVDPPIGEQLPRSC
jgi:hypothetical protein